MAIHFQSVDDLTDPALMKPALRGMLKYPGKFYFNATSSAIGGPVMIIAGPGARISPDLKREVKAGGSKVKGKYRKNKAGQLVFSTHREVNRSEMAEAIREIGKGFGVSILLQDIVIRTPSDRKRARRRRAAKALETS